MNPKPIPHIKSKSSWSAVVNSSRGTILTKDQTCSCGPNSSCNQLPLRLCYWSLLECSYWPQIFLFNLRLMVSAVPGTQNRSPKDQLPHFCLTRSQCYMPGLLVPLPPNYGFHLTIYRSSFHQQSILVPCFRVVLLSVFQYVVLLHLYNMPKLIKGE